MSQWPLIDLRVESILFNDDDLVAVDKASGELCDASRDPNRDHLGRALSRWAHDPNAQFLPAHRLDLGTSGVVLFARNRPAATALMQQFQDRLVTKRYQAIVTFRQAADWSVGQTINRRSYLRNRKGHSEEVRSGGKAAESDFEILAIEGQLGLVRALPKSGRTHQLRVHLAALDAPILGDDRYGEPTTGRLWLHADSLAISHPATGEPLLIESRNSFTLNDGQPRERTLD